MVSTAAMESYGGRKRKSSDEAKVVLKKACADTRSWSHLAWDLHDEILKHLNFIDHIIYGAVCTSWRFAVTGRRCCPAPHPPLLLIADQDDNGGCNGKAHLLDPSSRRLIPLTFPDSVREWRCCASSRGWFIMESDGKVRLFNPITGQIEPLLCLPQGISICSASLSDSPDSGEYFLALLCEEVHEASTSRNSSLWLCNPRDTWRVVSFRKSGRIPRNESRTSTIFSNRDILNSILTHPNDLGGFLTFPSFHYIKINRGGVLSSVAALHYFGGSEELERAHHMESKGEVIRVVCSYEDRHKVLRLDVVSGKWIDEDSLGDCSVYLGVEKSILFGAGDGGGGGGLERGCVHGFQVASSGDEILLKRGMFNNGVCRLTEESSVRIPATDRQPNRALHWVGWYSPNCNLEVLLKRAR